MPRKMPIIPENAEKIPEGNFSPEKMPCFLECYPDPGILFESGLRSEHLRYIRTQHGGTVLHSLPPERLYRVAKVEPGGRASLGEASLT